MRKPTDTLFRLISNMTPSEKRYYKRQHAGSTDALHNQFFDYLNGLSQYDEDEVRAFFEDSIGDNLKVYKSQLQERILKSLRLYHQDKSVSSQARNLLHDIEILLEKGLHEIARQKLGKVKQLCKKHEEFELLLVALGLEARLSTYFISNRRESALIIEDMRGCLQIINEYIQQAKLNNQLLVSYNTDYSDIKEKEKALDAILSKQAAFKNHSFKSFIARRMHQHSTALAHISKEQYQEASGVYKEVLQRFEEAKHLQKSHLLAYFNCHINFLSVCNFDGSCKESEEVAQNIDAILRKNPHLERFSLHSLYYRVYGLRKQQKWEACIALADRAYRIARRHDLMEEPVAQLCFLCTFQAHIVLGNYSSDTPQPFIDFFRREQYLPVSMRQVSYFLEMLQFYVSDNDDVLDSFISALSRRLHRREEEDEDLRYYRNFFRHLLRGLSSERLPIFEEALQYWKDRQDSPFHRALEGYFDWPEWLSAQMEGVPYKKYLAEHKSS